MVLVRRGKIEDWVGSLRDHPSRRISRRRSEDWASQVSLRLQFWTISCIRPRSIRTQLRRSFVGILTCSFARKGMISCFEILLA